MNSDDIRLNRFWKKIFASLISLAGIRESESSDNPEDEPVQAAPGLVRRDENGNVIDEDVEVDEYGMPIPSDEDGSRAPSDRANSDDPMSKGFLPIIEESEKGEPSIEYAPQNGIGVGGPKMPYGEGDGGQSGQSIEQVILSRNLMDESQKDKFREICDKLPKGFRDGESKELDRQLSKWSPDMGLGYGTGVSPTVGVPRHELEAALEKNISQMEASLKSKDHSGEGELLKERLDIQKALKNLTGKERKMWTGITNFLEKITEKNISSKYKTVLGPDGKPVKVELVPEDAQKRDEKISELHQQIKSAPVGGEHVALSEFLSADPEVAFGGITEDNWMPMVLMLQEVLNQDELFGKDPETLGSERKLIPLVLRGMEYLADEFSSGSIQKEDAGLPTELIDSLGGPRNRTRKSVSLNDWHHNNPTKIAIVASIYRTISEKTLVPSRKMAPPDLSVGTGTYSPSAEIGDIFLHEPLKGVLENAVSAVRDGDPDIQKWVNHAQEVAGDKAKEVGPEVFSGAFIDAINHAMSRYRSGPGDGAPSESAAIPIAPWTASTESGPEPESSPEVSHKSDEEQSRDIGRGLVVKEFLDKNPVPARKLQVAVDNDKWDMVDRLVAEMYPKYAELAADDAVDRGLFKSYVLMYARESGGELRAPQFSSADLSKDIYVLITDRPELKDHLPELLDAMEQKMANLEPAGDSNKGELEQLQFNLDNIQRMMAGMEKEKEMAPAAPEGQGIELISQISGAIADIAEDMKSIFNYPRKGPSDVVGDFGPEWQKANDDLLEKTRRLESLIGDGRQGGGPSHPIEGKEFNDELKEMAKECDLLDAAMAEASANVSKAIEEYEKETDLEKRREIKNHLESLNISQAVALRAAGMAHIARELYLVEHKRVKTPKNIPERPAAGEADLAAETKSPRPQGVPHAPGIQTLLPEDEKIPKLMPGEPSVQEKVLSDDELQKKVKEHLDRKHKEEASTVAEPPLAETEEAKKKTKIQKQDELLAAIKKIKERHSAGNGNR